MLYPSISEYINSLSFPYENLTELNNLRLAEDESGLAVYTNNASTVIFKMVDENMSYYGLKCFLKENVNREVLYSNENCFLFPSGTKYISEELYVDSNISDKEMHDVVIYPWVTYKTLFEFVTEKIDNKKALISLFSTLRNFFNEMLKSRLSIEGINADTIVIDNKGNVTIKNIDDCLVYNNHSISIKKDIYYILLAIRLIILDNTLFKSEHNAKYILFENSDTNINRLDKYLSYDDSDVKQYVGAILYLSNGGDDFNGIKAHAFSSDESKDVKNTITKAPLETPEGQVEYARQCYNQKDYENAFIWYSKAAEQGYGDGYNGIALCYEKGYYVEKNQDKAFEYYHKATDCGSLRGMYNLAYLYEHGQNNNFDKAEFYYRMSAERGHKISQYKVGIKYMYNKICLNSGIISSERDTVRAFDWFMKSAKQNYGPAQFRIGQFYETGTNPCVRNLTKAFDWYKQAMDNGTVAAIFAIGQLYANGIDDITPDDEEAYKYYLLAAEKGFEEAMYKTGIYLYYGRGINENKEEAIEWFTKASEKGNQEAEQFLLNIEEDDDNDNNSAIEVSPKELASAVMDSYGVLYSRDGKKLLKYSLEDTEISCSDCFSHTRESFRQYKVHEGVEIICHSAFWDCTSLVQIEFPSSLKIIGDAAFCGCSNLRTVIVKEGFHEIGPMAFSGCEQLKGFVLPASLKKIGGDAFSQVRSIESHNPLYVIYEECLYDSSKTKLLHFFNNGRKEFCIPKYTKVIEDSAFMNSGLRIVQFNEELESINNQAFEGCKDLLYLNFPNSLKHIGSMAFSGCEKIRSVIIPQNVKVIEGLCFSGCRNLTAVKLHDEIKAINTLAFTGTEIEKIILPQKLETLAPMAFGFTPLRTIIANCDNFIVKDGVIYNKDMTTLVQYYGDNERFEIPNGVKEVNSFAFAFRWIKEEIVFPDTIEKVGSSLFEQVPAPNRVVVPARLKQMVSDSIESYYRDRIVTI